jgi:hypothetical protein
VTELGVSAGSSTAESSPTPLSGCTRLADAAFHRQLRNLAYLHHGQSSSRVSSEEVALADLARLWLVDAAVGRSQQGGASVENNLFAPTHSRVVLLLKI